MQHLDEGTIHAWLDGQLPPEEARQVEAHVAECRQCADAVAEARGLIAASSRILMALDGVPGDVVPKSAPSRPTQAESEVTAAPVAPRVETKAEQRARRRWFGGPSLAAAAAIVVAIGTLTLSRASKRASSLESADKAVVASPAAGPAVADSTSVVAAAPARPVSASTSTRAEPPAAQALGERREVAADQPSPSAGAPSARALATEFGRAATTGAQRSDEAKKDGFNKPTDQLEKDRKQEALQAAARDVALRDARAVADTVRLDRTQQVAAAKVAAVAVGGLRGRVVDSNNTGLSGAMVNVTGTTIGAPTNDAGEYALGGVPVGSQELNVRRLGYNVATRPVTVVAGQTTPANVVLIPATTTLSRLAPAAVGGAVSATEANRQKVAAAPAAPTPAGAPPPAFPPTSAGCYDLGITPGNSPSRTGFRQMPRQVALDNEVAPSTAEGVWYRARDLAKTGALPNGTWRPTGPESIEVSWTYGSRTAQVFLNGAPGAMLRGTIQEIDRATATGEAGTVVTIRRACE